MNLAHSSRKKPTVDLVSRSPHAGLQSSGLNVSRPAKLRRGTMRSVTGLGPNFLSLYFFLVRESEGTDNKTS